MGRREAGHRRSGVKQMAGFTPFSNNYRDLPDENGYQFEFVCDICGSGYRSEFQRSGAWQRDLAAGRGRQPDRRPVGCSGGGTRRKGLSWTAAHAMRRSRRRQPSSCRTSRSVRAISDGLIRPAGTRRGASASRTPRSLPPRWRLSEPRLRSARCARRCRASRSSQAICQPGAKFCANCGTATVASA